jgi:hypothetical protein
MPSAARTASNAVVNRESRSRRRKLMVATRSPRSISRFRAAWVAPPGKMRRYSGQMCLAGAMFDGDQCVDPPEKRSVHVHEVHR